MSASGNETSEKYELIAIDYDKVQLPLVLSLVVLAIIACNLGHSYLKIGCEKIITSIQRKKEEKETSCYSSFVTKIALILQSIPETCLLIILGIILGLILPDSVLKPGTMLNYLLDPHVFFLYILPPIVFEAGYELPRASFLSNFVDVLVYAILGTTLNTFLIGSSLYGIMSAIGFDKLDQILDKESTSLFVFLLFGAIISAVDPVAVISVFQEIKVNVNLYILVLGESILNDGVAIVFFLVFSKFIELGSSNVDVGIIFLGVVNFFIISIGGALIGILVGLLTAFFSKFTYVIGSKYLDTALILSMAYLSYLLAEMFEISSILSIVFCGFAMRFYVEKNSDKNNVLFLHSINKMMATLAEMIIFVVLGLAATRVSWTKYFDWKFSLVTLLLCSVVRPVVVYSLTFLLNLKRVNKLDWKDQFIMSFSGLRGGIAYSLIRLANVENTFDTHLQQIFLTTTIFVIFFTVFIQGSLVEPIIKLLEIRIEKPEDRQSYNLFCSVNDKFINHTTDGIISIIGSSGGSSNYNYVNKFENLLAGSALNRFLLREKNLRDMENLDSMEIAEIWSAELRQDLASFVKLGADTGSSAAKEAEKNITKQHLLTQLNAVIDDNSLPWKSMNAIKNGQSGISNEVEKKIGRKQIQDKVYLKDSGVKKDSDLTYENFESLAQRRILEKTVSLWKSNVVRKRNTQVRKSENLYYVRNHDF